MTVKEIAQKLSLNAVVEADSDFCVRGCYIGDLLSLVMSKAQSGEAWITIQGNVNVPAVASLTGVAMVILAEGMTLAENARMRAEEENIAIYSSEKSAYQLACEIHNCL